MNRDLKRFGKLSLTSWLLSLWLLCAAPVVTLADRLDKGAKAEKGAKIEKADHAAAASPSNAPTSVNEDVGPEVQGFMEKHSKRKWAAYQKLNSENRRALSGQLVNRFGELKKVANKDLYELEVQRVEIEDDLFGALSALKRAKSPADEDQARKELRPVVERLIQNRMEERAVRLKSVKAQLGNLEKEVARDEKLKSDPGRFLDFITRRAGEIERHGSGGWCRRPRRSR